MRVPHSHPIVPSGLNRASRWETFQISTYFREPSSPPSDFFSPSDGGRLIHRERKFNHSALQVTYLTNPLHKPNPPTTQNEASR